MMNILRLGFNRTEGQFLLRSLGNQYNRWQKIISQITEEDEIADYRSDGLLLAGIIDDIKKEIFKKEPFEISLDYKPTLFLIGAVKNELKSGNPDRELTEPLIEKLKTNASSIYGKEILELAESLDD